jgi:hypothetical protein
MLIVWMLLLPSIAHAQELKTLLTEAAGRLAQMWNGGFENANQVNEQEREHPPRRPHHPDTDMVGDEYAYDARRWLGNSQQSHELA